MFDFEILTHWAKEKPDALAFVDDSHSLNFAQLNILTRSMAGFLQSKGVKPGDLVNVFLPTYLNWVTTLSLHLLGCVTMSRKEVAFSAPVVIPDWHISMKSDPAIESSKTLLFEDSLFREATSCKPIIEYRGYSEEDEIVRLVGTSGTTGDMKFVPIHAGDFEPMIKRKSSWDGVQQGNVLSLYPLGGKQTYRNALRSLALGETFYYIDRNGYQIAKILRRNDIATLSGSPTQISHVVEILRQTGTSLPELKSVVMGGSEPTPQLINRIKEWMNCRIFNAYGSTEVGNASLMEITDGIPEGSILNSQVTLEIVDDQDNLLASGEIGRIRYKSPDMARGYYKNPVATGEFFKDGYFYPGDLGRLTHDGLLVLEGRINEVINLGGVKFNPEVVDRVAIAQLGVIDCAAFPVVSKDGKEQLAIALVHDEDFDLQTFGKVMSKKAPFVPEIYIKRSFIPRNENGKILRRKLTDEYMESLNP